MQKKILIALLIISLLFGLSGWRKYLNIRDELFNYASTDFDHKLLLAVQNLEELNKQVEESKDLAYQIQETTSWLRRLQQSSALYFKMLEYRSPDVYPEQIRFDIATTNVKALEDLITKPQLSEDGRQLIRELTARYQKLRKVLTTQVIINAEFKEPLEEYNKAFHPEIK